MFGTAPVEEKLLDFCRSAREAGLPVGSRETLLVLGAADLGFFSSTESASAWPRAV